MNFVAHLLVAATLVVFGPSCLPKEQGGGVDWPKVAHCGPNIEDVIGAVERILFADGMKPEVSESGKQELEQLAIKHGANTIACLVDTLIEQWTAPGATQLPERTAAMKRGAAFLRTEGVEKVERD